ncbi:unnamed protein product [Linum tenue]|uniref:Ig-like domain-containing protein n=1 Tax=Linum tenue TaxID=586396 RepID=A0AAV0JQK6_9ROSI|nr:unnamed protein product [Linum tenue]
MPSRGDRASSLLQQIVELTEAESSGSDVLLRCKADGDRGTGADRLWLEKKQEVMRVNSSGKRSSQVGSLARLDLQWEKNGVVDVHDFDISTSKGSFVMKPLSLVSNLLQVWNQCRPSHRRSVGQQMSSKRNMPNLSHKADQNSLLLAV